MILSYTLALGAAAVVLLCFVRAWTSGVLPMYWGLGGLISGLITGGLIFQILPNVMQIALPKVQISLAVYGTLAVVSGLIAYAIIRTILKGILGTVFNTDSFLHRFTNGFLGACLSLLPSILAVFLIGFSLRTVGTLLEFRHLETVADESRQYGPTNYPGWPRTAEYRQALERLPMVKSIYNPLDPISQIAKRNLVSILIARKRGALAEALTTDPDVATLVAQPLFESIKTDPVVLDLLAQRKHIALLNYAPLRKAVLDREFREALQEIELQSLVDRYFLDENRTLEKSDQKDNDGFDPLKL